MFLRFLLIFCKYDTQCNVYNYLPLQPPLMPLGLSFNQYGLYPCVSFWSPSLSRDLVISQLVGLMTCYVPIRISSLGKSLTISMKQRADRLLLRIYFAPYGRTNNMIMNMCFVDMGLLPQTHAFLWSISLPVHTRFGWLPPA